MPSWERVGKFADLAQVVQFVAWILSASVLTSIVKLVLGKISFLDPAILWAIAVFIGVCAIWVVVGVNRLRIVPPQRQQRQAKLSEAEILDVVSRAVQPLLGRVMALEDKIEALPKLVVIGRTSHEVRARLGDREIEMEPAAADYYADHLEDHHREKINSKIRRHPWKTRWGKREFLAEVDEKARVRMTLDDFIGAGNRLLERAKSLVIPEIPPLAPPPLGEVGPLSIASATLTHSFKLPSPSPLPAFELVMLRTDIETWEKRFINSLSKKQLATPRNFIAALNLKAPQKTKNLFIALRCA